MPVLKMDTIARAFNEGCDARLAGVSRASNPYKGQPGMEFRWDSGWTHVDTNWGKDAKWPIASLPKI